MPVPGIGICQYKNLLITITYSYIPFLLLYITVIIFELGITMHATGMTLLASILYCMQGFPAVIQSRSESREHGLEMHTLPQS